MTRDGLGRELMKLSAEGGARLAVGLSRPSVSARRGIRYRTHRWALRILVLCPLFFAAAIPADVLGQVESDLVRFVLKGYLDERIQVDAVPPFVCIAVRGVTDSEIRDANADEMPEAPNAVQLAAASACVERRAGASHVTSGEQALILKIGVVELSGTSATYTLGWFRDGLDAGAVRCGATWSEEAWERSDCRPLWVS